MKKISVVIPTYNEWGNIEKLIPAIFDVFSKLSKYKLRIVVVDDDSPDGTGKRLRKKYKSNNRVSVIVRKNSRGLGEAILDGILKSDGEVVVGMDADFNHDPGALPSLVKKTKNADFVSASRFVPKGGMDDKKRYILTKAYNRILVNVCEFPLTDNMSGYYAVRRNLLNELPLKRVYRGYGEYHLRLARAIQLLSKNTDEVPVWYRRRMYGKSKSHLAKMFFSYTKEAIRLSWIKSVSQI